jgi:hypothetical protein
VAALFVLTLADWDAPFLSVVTFTCLVAFVVWTALSLLWSTDLTSGIQNVQRDLAYVAAAGAALALGSRARGLRDAVLFASGVLTVYSVATHLAPDVFGFFSQVTVPGRLYYPLGYWNTQGTLGSLAVILLADAVANGSRPLTRALCAAVLPWPAVDILLTLSRGAELSLLFGVVIWIALDVKRVRTSALLIGLSLPIAVAAWLADDAAPLYGRRYSPASAPAGHRLIGELVVLSAVTAAVTWLLVKRASSVSVPRWTRHLYLVLLGALAFSALGLAVATYGDPAEWPASTYRSFTAKPTGQFVPSRLTTFSLNNRNLLWSVAVSQAGSNVMLGSGAGTFGSRWYRERSVPIDTTSAHSLYLETFAESGLVGLALIAGATLLPLIASVRSRALRHVPAMAGGFGACILHSGVDWDWLIPGMTIPAIWLGYAILASQPNARTVRLTGAVRLGVGALLAAVAVLATVGLLGNIALSRSYEAANSGKYRAAISDGHNAADWQPWSFLPWMEIGTANQALGQHAAAVQAYRVAASRDPVRWEPWVSLAAVAAGGERTRALEEGFRLNPLSRQLRALCKRSGAPGCPHRLAGLQRGP